MPDSTSASFPTHQLRSASNEEQRLLGLALICAQRVEVHLIGLASLASNLVSNSQFRWARNLEGLTFDKYVRGDFAEIRVTLGQLFSLFGEEIMIEADDLRGFCENRNLIAHRYLSQFMYNASGNPTDEEAHAFLRNFIDEAERWTAVLRGFSRLWQRTAAEHQEVSDFEYTTADIANIMAYHRQAAKHLKQRWATIKAVGGN